MRGGHVLCYGGRRDDCRELSPVGKRHLRLRVGTGGRQIEPNPEVVLIRRKLVVENPTRCVRDGRQCEVIMGIGIVDFMQEQGHRLAWLPAGTGHGDEFAWCIVIFVRLYLSRSRTAQSWRAPSPPATRSRPSKPSGLPVEPDARCRHRARRIEITIPGPEQFCRGQGGSA